MTYAYTMTISKGLWDNWEWFEVRGYLPAMPGILIDTMGVDYPGQDCLLPNEIEYTQGVQEHEAWEFEEACKELGEDYGTCLGKRDLGMIEDFRAQIV